MDGLSEQLQSRNKVSNSPFQKSVIQFFFRLEIEISLNSLIKYICSLLRVL